MSSYPVNVFTLEDSLFLNKVKFFTAKSDKKGRIQIPAFVRKQLGVSFRSLVLLGLELGDELLFLKRQVDGKGRVYLSSIPDGCMVSVELMEEYGFYENK